MHRFHIPPGTANGAEVLLSPEESHHALRVLRLAPGDAVTLLDGVLCRPRRNFTALYQQPLLLNLA